MGFFVFVMGKFVVVCFLFVLCVGLSSSQNLSCATVDCADPACEEACVIYESTEDVACCPSCCPSSCVQCFVNPCDNYVCESDPELRCEPNYCGGCNRYWYSPTFFGYVECENESISSQNNADDDDDVFTTLDDDTDSTSSSSILNTNVNTPSRDTSDSTSVSDDDTSGAASAFLSLVAAGFCLLAF